MRFIDSSTVKEIVITKRGADLADVRFNLVLASSATVEKALMIASVLPGLNRVHTLEEVLATMSQHERSA